MSDPAFAATLEDTLTKLSAEGADVEAAVNPFAAGRRDDGDLGAGVIDSDIAKTLEGMAQAAGDMEGMDPTAAEAMGEVWRVNSNNRTETLPCMISLLYIMI